MDGQRVVILGGGFGGVYTALHLRRHLKQREADITVVSKTDHFLFTPLLHEVAAGLLPPEDVAHPLAPLLGRRARFAEATVTEIDTPARIVRTTAGDLPYDTLVIALGSETNYYGMPDVEAYSLPLKTLVDALRLRRHFLGLFSRAAEAGSDEERRRLLTVVLAGAGCTGVELVAELHHLVTTSLKHAFPEIDVERDVRLVVAEVTDRLLCPKDVALAERAKQAMLSRRIETLLHTAVTGRDTGGVLLRDLRTNDGFRIDAETLIWTAGVAPNRLVRELPFPKDRRGSLIVDETLRVDGRADGYALGDCAATPHEEDTVPWTAQAAMQQARTVARNVTATLKGERPIPFRYRSMGEVITLGGAEGLSDVFGLRLGGVSGWLAARAAHLARLPDWSDRVRVAVEWGLDFLGPRETGRSPLLTSDHRM